MPMLIVFLIAAMAIFFVKSKPTESAKPQEMVSVKEEVLSPESEAPSGVKDFDPSSDIEGTESEVEVDVTPNEEAAQGINTVSAPPESTGEFTAWMSPLALDTYIRLKNEGYSESFWQRGHWITAVEGRWANGSHEFRIALDRVPDLNRWQWQYRVNQSTSDFANASKNFAERGFQLVQTQTFTDPDGTTKIQAVWQRDFSATAPVVEISTPTVPSTSSPEALDVNNLQFR